MMKLLNGVYFTLLYFNHFLIACFNKSLLWVYFGRREVFFPKLLLLLPRLLLSKIGIAASQRTDCRLIVFLRVAKRQDLWLPTPELHVFVIRWVSSELVSFFCYRYIPVLMSQAKIYWDLDNYAQVEKVSDSSTSFSGSLFFPPPGAREGWEEERPWERGWVVVMYHRTLVLT